MLHPPKSALALLAALALPFAVVAPASAMASAHATATAAATSGTAGTSAAETYGWGTPTGGDEFNGTTLDTSTWEPYAGAGNAGQGARDPAQITVSGGVVSINGTSAGTTGGFSDRTDHRYGRWETRMRVPSGDARYHPVLLLWPGSVAWPQGGEVDYAETTTAATDMSFFLHYSAANQQTYAQTPVDLTQWHDYAVQWTSAGVTGYIDGVQVFSDTTPAHQPPAEMHSSIQLDWFPSGASATTPSSLQVDWTRFYPV